MVEGREPVEFVLKRLKAQEEERKNVIKKIFRGEKPVFKDEEDKPITPKKLAVRKLEESLKKIRHLERKVEQGESYLAYYADIINAKKEFLNEFEEFEKNFEDKKDPVLVNFKLIKIQIEKDLKYRA